MIFKNISPLKMWAALLVTIVMGTSDIWAQGEKVVFPVRNVTLKMAIAEIEKQTDYIIAINDAHLDDVYVITLSNNELRLDRALDQVFTNMGLEWTIRNKYIVVSKRVPKRAPVEKEPQVPVAENKEFSPDKVGGLLTDSHVSRTAVRYGAISDASSYSAYAPPSRYSYSNRKPPGYAVKVNLLYGGAALTPNLAFEFGTGKHSTVEVSGGYSWWGRKSPASEQHKQFAHYIVRPEYRYWLCERFNGHYFGVSAFYGRYYISGYNVPILFDKEYSYDGWVLGAGVDYGYHWAFAGRWGLDFNIGLGYARFDYTKGSCAKCSSNREPVVMHYLGPVRAGITLVFMIK